MQPATSTPQQPVPPTSTSTYAPRPPSPSTRCARDTRLLEKTLALIGNQPEVMMWILELISARKELECSSSSESESESSPDDEATSSVFERESSQARPLPTSSVKSRITSSCALLRASPSTCLRLPCGVTSRGSTARRAAASHAPPLRPSIDPSHGWGVPPITSSMDTTAKSTSSSTICAPETSSSACSCACSIPIQCKFRSRAVMLHGMPASSSSPPPSIPPASSDTGKM